MNRILLATSMAGFLALGACSKADDKGNLAAAEPGNASSAQVAAAADALPAECNDYIERVKLCVKKTGAGNPAMASMEQQLDQSKVQWAKAGASGVAAAQCKQMNDGFAQVGKAMGC